MTGVADSPTQARTQLRGFIHLDRLQPQTMCYLGSWIRGTLPRAGDAAQVVEVSPGLDIEPLTDVALKHARVSSGMLVVERQFGYLEFHGPNDAVRAAAGAVLEHLDSDASTADATRRCWPSTIMSRIDSQHAFLINRNKLGSMALPGESVFVLEMQPASYAILAANEAEKAVGPGIKVVDYRMVGATGRVYLSGQEADVRQAAEAARVRAHHAVGARGSRAMTDLETSDALRRMVREVLQEVLPRDAATTAHDRPRTPHPRTPLVSTYAGSVSATTTTSPPW